MNDLSRGQYSVNTNIKLKTPMRRSDLCDSSDAYNVIKGEKLLKALLMLTEKIKR